MQTTITLTIESLGSQGEGVGRYEGYTVFVPGALPGEHIEAKLIQRSARYARGQLLRVLKVSEERRDPPCKLFGRCGGCQLMHLSYEAQLQVKRQRVVDALQRIGAISDVEVDDCQPSPLELAYRNKIQLPVREDDNGRLQLGLYASGSHDLVPISHCHIHCSLGDDVYRQVCVILQKAVITAYNPQTGRGELRHLLLKSAVASREVLVTFISAKKSSANLVPIAQEIMERCPSVKGVVHNINAKCDNTILGSTFRTILGEGYLCEILGNLKFLISPASFFQVNPSQAEKLYSKVLELAQLSGNERVLDSYCGVGTLALFLASKAKIVIGVEAVPCAIDDAEKNARLNEIENAQFICGDSAKVIPQLADIDVAILNPPRKGCDAVVLQALAKIGPRKIIYISCDPATLARDLSLLRQHGYAIDGIHPFDMFPQTSHVETIASLNKIQ